MQYRKDIQGLRAIAFLMVYIFHLNAGWLSGGFLGVDVFFVLSGYLMATITMSALDNNTFGFLDFYKRRFQRIIPAYFILLLVVGLIWPFIYLYHDIGVLKGTLSRAALFLSNLAFQNGDSYFGAQMSENPLLHTWSLSIEFQFYFLIPIFLVYLRKHALKLTIALILIISLYTSYDIIFNDSKYIVYFSLLARIPEFLVGVAFSLLFKEGIYLKQSISNVLCTIAAAVLIVCSIVFDEKSAFPGALALLPCICVGIILCIRGSILEQILSNSVLMYIGKLSYSLYLWHWPIMAYVRYYYGNYEFSLLQVGLVSVATFVCAYLSYQFIERKIIINQLKTGLALIITCIGSILIFSFTAPSIFDYKKIAMEYLASPKEINYNITQGLEKYGAPDRNDKILLIGNSHAQNLKPFFNQLGKQKDFSINAFTVSRVAALRGVEKLDLEKNYKDVTIQSIPIADSLLADAETIIFSILIIDHEYDIISEAIRNMVAKLKPTQKLIFIKSFPTIDKDPIRLNRGFIKNSDYQYELKMPHLINNFYDSLAQQYANIRTFNITDLDIWKNGPFINDTVSYYDKVHINEYTSLKLLDIIGDDIHHLMIN